MWLETVTDGTLCGRLVTLQEGVDIMYNGAQTRERIISLLKEQFQNVWQTLIRLLHCSAQ